MLDAGICTTDDAARPAGRAVAAREYSWLPRRSRKDVLRGDAKGIVWLASYPKSGNTWLRIMLGCLLETDWDPEEINAIPIGFPVGRVLFDETLGVESSNLTIGQIELLRPRLYERLRAETEGPLFCKTHDAWTLNGAGEPLLSRVTAAAVYIVRNPLDVAVSYAHHLGREVDQAIRVMARRAAVLDRAGRRMDNQLPQRVLSWSDHVRSWLDEAPVPVLVVRYEDMRADTARVLGQVARFCGLDADEEAVRGAVAAAAFERLQALEQERGFCEKPPVAARFFRSGKAGGWRGALTEAQVRRILESHGAMMRRLGYLDEAGDPLTGEDGRE